MELVPVTLDEAKQFVAKHHRHNDAPLSWKFGVGLSANNKLIGVAMAGRPEGRGIDKFQNIEITRVCVIEKKNANSKLYGNILRACKSLGYRVAYSYTLAEESGASLRAVGFEVDAELPPRPTWDTPARRRQQVDMFGNERRPSGPKIRWKKVL
jgi:hypothetical protein